jgi:hypothetical protein
VRNATAYYRSWLQQKNFYWQLAWRAPSIQPDTALLSNDELFIYVGRAATAMAVNLLYPQPAGDRALDTWFLELPHDIGPKQVEKLPRGKALNPTFRIYSFTGSSLDSLVLFYKPGAGRCLWVLSPEDAANPDLPELTRAALPASNLGRITAGPPKGDYPPVEIFGPEPAHSWCYYYQKADLARQGGDWEVVLRLADEAQAQGFAPGNPHEQLPFIEGYARTGSWDEALERTREAFELDADAAPELCHVWKRILNEAIPADAGTQGEMLTELAPLGCTFSAPGE